LDWYLAPKSQRKGSVALDNIYIRLQIDNCQITLGQYGRQNEFKMTYEGPSARDEVQSWYDTITKAIDDYKRKKIETSNENFKYVVDKGIEKEGDFIAGNNKEETYTTTTVQNVSTPPPPQPQVVQTVIQPQPQPQVMQTFTTPVMVQPMMQPVVTQTVTTPGMMPMVQPMIHQTVTTPYNPYFPPQPYNPYPQVQQTTQFYNPYGATTGGMPMMCQFCRNQFSATPGGFVRCPFCQQVNNLAPTTSVTYTTAPPYF